MSGFLGRDMMRFDTAFPPLGYLPPSNPTAYNEWKLSIQGDVVEEEGAPWFREDLARFYVQDFRRADWAPNFKKELRRRRNEGRLWAEPTWTLPEDTKQELDIFAEHLPPVPPVATPFPWGLLPNELKIRVINMLFRYTETLKVTAFAIVKPPGTASSTTPAEEAASSRYAFRLVAKAPKALIPQTQQSLECAQVRPEVLEARQTKRLVGGAHSEQRVRRPHQRSILWREHI